MDHTMHGDQHGGMQAMPTDGAAMEGHEEDHASNFLGNWGEDEEQLLGMLHVPLLHGGVKEVLLLSSLSTASPGSFSLACFVLLLCAALLEALKMAIWWVETKRINREKPRGSCECKHCTGVTVSLRGVTEGKQYDAIHDSASGDSLNILATNTASQRGMSVWLCLLGLLHLLTYLSSTLLMLIAMTMNIYLILSMATGAALGRIACLVARKKLEGCCK